MFPCAFDYYLFHGFLSCEHSDIAQEKQGAIAFIVTRIGYEICTIPETEAGIKAEAVRRKLDELDSRKKQISFFYFLTVNNPTATIMKNQEIASYILDNHIDIQIKKGKMGYRTKALQVEKWIKDFLGKHVSAYTGGRASFYFYLIFKQIET